MPSEMMVREFVVPRNNREIPEALAYVRENYMQDHLLHAYAEREWVPCEGGWRPDGEPPEVWSYDAAFKVGDGPREMRFRVKGGGLLSCRPVPMWPKEGVFASWVGVWAYPSLTLLYEDGDRLHCGTRALPERVAVAGAVKNGCAQVVYGAMIYSGWKPVEHGPFVVDVRELVRNRHCLACDEESLRLSGMSWTWGCTKCGLDYGTTDTWKE